MSSVVSVRFPDAVADRLREHAGRGTESASGLAVRLVDEGLRMAEHPGIVFRDGPAGRRAALQVGPDVWEVVALLSSLEVRGDAAVDEAAAWLDLPTSRVRVALGYYGAYPDEIDAQVVDNERVAERARAAAEAQRRLLDGPADRPPNGPTGARSTVA